MHHWEMLTQQHCRLPSSSAMSGCASTGGCVPLIAADACIVSLGFRHCMPGWTARLEQTIGLAPSNQRPRWRCQSVIQSKGKGFHATQQHRATNFQTWTDSPKPADHRSSVSILPSACLECLVFAASHPQPASMQGHADAKAPCSYATCLTGHRASPPAGTADH